MLKTISLIILATVLISCQNGKNKENQNKYTFYIGTYTDTNSKGIYKLGIDEWGHFQNNLSLQVESENPSFLCFANNGKHLLTVNETDSFHGLGSVESYEVGGQLKLVSRESSGGAHPCFVTANKEGVVLTANYTGGNTGLLRIDSNGKLSELLDVNQHEGSGTNLQRQDKPHAHSIWFQPNSDKVIAVDLGTNELWFSKLDSNQFVPLKNQRLPLPDGAGPRHLALHPKGKFMYVINELNNTISVIQVSNKACQIISNHSTLPHNFKGTSYTADIRISSDGKFLYGSNRGHNSIVMYSITENGQLQLIAHESVRGDHPRNFSLTPDEKFLVVANQNTNNIVCFKRDMETGLLTFVDEVNIPKPVCILFNLSPK